MPIRFRCVHCKQLLGIAESRAGARVDCPGCGRSVQVPRSEGQTAGSPAINRDRDPELTEALSQLSALNADPSALSNQSLQPVILPARPDTSTVQPRPKQQSSRHPDSSDLKPRPLPGVSPVAPEDDNDDGTPARDDHWQRALGDLTLNQPESAGQLQQLVPLPARLRHVVAAAALLVGVLLGFGIARVLVPPMIAPQTAAPSEDKGDPGDEPPGAAIPQLESDRGSVVGTVTWSEPGRDMTADAGALVLLLPAQRDGRWKLDGRPIRSVTDGSDHLAVMAALKALGVAVQLTDDSGHFDLDRLSDGDTVLVVISRHVRQTDEALNARAIDVLAGWFDNPNQLTGRLAAKTQLVPADSGPESTSQRFDMEFP